VSEDRPIPAVVATRGLVSREGQVAIQSAVALEAVMPEPDPAMRMKSRQRSHQELPH
jgi:hypothetical protein